MSTLQWLLIFHCPLVSTSPCHTEESNSSHPSIDFPTTSTPYQPHKKRKVTKSDEVDELILRSLKGIEDKQAQRQDDEDELYGRQVAATMQCFTNREKALAKLHIQQVLLDIEFPAEHPHPQHSHGSQSYLPTLDITTINNSYIFCPP